MVTKEEEIKGQIVPPDKEVVTQTNNDVLVQQGIFLTAEQTPTALIADEVGYLLEPLLKDDSTDVLFGEKTFKILKSLVCSSPHAIKATGLYKQNVCTNIKYEYKDNKDENSTEYLELKKDWDSFFAKLMPSYLGSDLKEGLIEHFLTNLLLQGGIAFIVLLDDVNGSYQYQLVDIPLYKLKPEYDKDTQTWNYTCEDITIPDGFKEFYKNVKQKEIKYINELGNVKIFLYTMEPNSMKTLPIYGSAIYPLYRLSLLERFTTDLIKRKAALNFTQISLDVEEYMKPPNGIDNSINEKKSEKALKDISDSLQNIQSVIIKSGETPATGAPVGILSQGLLIGKKGVDITTHETLSKNGIPSLQFTEKQIEKLIPSSLQVPASLLGLKESNSVIDNSNNLDTEVGLFLDKCKQIREYIGSILLELARFRMLVDQSVKPLEGFNIVLEERDADRKRKEKEDLVASIDVDIKKLEKLKLLKELGYEINQETLEETLGYEKNSLIKIQNNDINDINNDNNNGEENQS